MYSSQIWIFYPSDMESAKKRQKYMLVWIFDHAVSLNLDVPDL